MKAWVIAAFLTAVSAGSIGVGAPGADPNPPPRAPIDPPPTDQPTPVPVILERTLDNGMRILLVEDHRVPRVAANLWIRIGSIPEPVGLHGITHFLEHAIHQGSTTFGTSDLSAELPLLRRIHETEQQLIAAQRRARNHLRERSVFYDELTWPSTPEIDSLRAALYRLEDEDTQYREFWESYKWYLRHGGRTRHTDPVPASTEQEYLEIGMALPTNAIELFFRVEADRMANAVLRGWEAQRFTVLEQILGARSRPQIRFNEAIDAVTGLAHPVYQPDGGHPRDFNNFTRAAMIDLYERYFVPNNLTLVLVGDLTLPNAAALAERYFGRLPRGPEPPADLDLEAEPVPSGAVRLDWTEPLSPQVHVRYRIPGIGHPDRPIFDLVAAMLTGAGSVASRRLANDAAHADFRVIHTSRFGSTAGFNLVAPGGSDENLVEVERGLLAAIDDLREGRFDRAQLERARKRLRLEWAKVRNRPVELAFVIGHYHTMNDWSTLPELLQARDTASAEQVVRVARTYLVPSNRVVAVARARPAPGSGPSWLDSAWSRHRPGARRP
jgi:predicted Zn-dependent peptidase